MAHFLEIEHVSKTFGANGAAGIHVIDDISMTVDEGEVVVYLGPSGCGKSTLMRMVGGLETVTSGRIILEGKEVKGPDRQKGMVFQSYSSFPWLKVIDNVRFGLKFRTDSTPGRRTGSRATICRWSALASSRITGSTASPAACASAWRSRAPSPRGRISC